MRLLFNPYFCDMKFQKSISLFLAFFLFLSNIGLAMNVHYCDDEIASVSLNTTLNFSAVEENCCGSVEKQSHCCSDKVVHFEKKTTPATVFTFQLDCVDVFVHDIWQPIAFSSFSINEFNSSSEYSFQSNAPPLFKLYSQYIFYDCL